MSRKRMSVGTAPASAAGGEAGSRSLADAGLEGLFTADASKAIYVSSSTDRRLEKVKQFTEKERVTLVPPGKDDSEMLSWVQSKTGFACKKGLKPESANQDSMSVVVVEGEFAMYGVYDGHGPGGHFVSDEALRIICKSFLESEARHTDPAAVLKRIFVETQEALEKLSGKKAGYDFSSSGSTCTVVYHDFKLDKVTVAWVGDSRCVIGTVDDMDKKKVCMETVDHKPENEEEKKRIENANPPGRVIFDGYYNYRVFSQKGMYPGLNMSRALGDIVAHKEAGLTAEPEIIELELSKERGPGKKFVMLVCTDGVWEFLKNEDALNKVKGTSLQQVAEDLAKASYDLWMQDSEGEITDDITVIAVEL